MAMPIDAQPRYQNNIEFKSLNKICRFKEHLARAATREFGLMPNYDIRSPDLKDRMVKAWEGEFVIFRDIFKAELWWPLYHFFVGLLVEHSMYLGQIVPYAWRMLICFL